MDTTSRVTSILNAKNLDTAVTGVQAFELSVLDLSTELNFELPTNVRLGHLTEKVVSELIKASTNFDVLFENIQIIENKNTIGEIDFILQEIKTKQVIHIELAYKFYLYDPTLSSNQQDNWIGPNRNDSLKQKLEKLKKKQFPLLHHPCAQSIFGAVETEKATQALCLLVSLFVPYEFKGVLNPEYGKAVSGYYIGFEQFTSLDNPEKTYYIPSKKEWGMEPSENEEWTSLDEIETQIATSMREKQAALCWQKHSGVYSTFFIVWW